MVGCLGFPQVRSLDFSFPCLLLYYTKVTTYLPMALPICHGFTCITDEIRNIIREKGLGISEKKRRIRIPL